MRANVNTGIDFNEYKLKHLATGGYANLYIASPRHLKKPQLCLKFLKKTLTKNSIHLNHFQEELLLLKSFQHTNLPQIIHNGSNDGRPYLAYIYIEGRSVLNLLQESVRNDRNLIQAIKKPATWLLEHLNKSSRVFHIKKNHKISTQLAIKIMIQLLTILDYLHSQPEPVVHSDVSPENLLLDHTNKLFLIDFGCAKKVKSGKKENINWVGKSSYLSPEQAQGLDWDQRSDLYQAGIVFYELLCHHKKNTGINEQKARIIASNPPLPNFFHIPSFLHAFMTKLLHNDLDQRWQSANECMATLKNISSKIVDAE